MTTDATPVIPDEDHRILDPENDIDAKRTVFWLVLWTAILFGALYVMLQVFRVVMHDERQKKLALPGIELQQQRQRAVAELHATGTNDDGTRRVGIDEAIEIYVRK